jgi:alcohol dehydrogenase/L-iditol 2-dehydrogenase
VRGGRRAAAGEAVARAAPGGLIVLIGQNGQPAELATQAIVQKQLVLMGSLIYDHPGDFTAALSEPDGGRAGTVLRACYPMTEAAEAFRAARGVAGKTWIRVGR